MAVKFAVLGGGDTLATTFSDSFIRANANTWGPNWIRTSANQPGGGGNGVTAFASVNTNQAVMQTIGAVGATQEYEILWIPLPVYFNVQNAAGYFVQFTFISVTASGWGSVLRYNHNLENTQTQAEGADYYAMLFNGRIDKRVGGGVAATIGATTWAQVANDVLRFEVLTSGSSVLLQSIRNGAVLQTVTDSTATRILKGGPGIGIFSYGASGDQSKFTTFSCGPISRLS